MTRVAPAAQSILTQATRLRPGRSKASDGTVGDRAHRLRPSDHNPDRRGIVHAADLTHDPTHGMDAHDWAKWLAARRDPRVKYIISNRRIWQPGTGWSAYGGENPHTKHVHVSVTVAGENDTSPWFAGYLTPIGATPPPAPPAPAAPPPPAPPVAPASIPPPYIAPQEDDMKVFKLVFSNRTENWLLYSDGWRTNLAGPNEAADVAALTAAFPVVVLAGDDACSRWKNFTTERTYASLQQRPLT